MCGIFGVLLRPDSQLSYREVSSTLAKLYELSESRGKESAGLYAYIPTDGQSWTIKVARRASELLRSRQYLDWTKGPLRSIFSGPHEHPSSPLALLAHSRLVTNGRAELKQNNQPTRWGAVTMIHNGIVVNVDELWAEHSHLKRNAEVDTEVMAALAADAVTKGYSPIEATTGIFSRIRGAASVAWAHEQANWVVLATNTGDLYRYTNFELGYTIFASEHYILKRTFQHLSHNTANGEGIGEWLSPGHGVLLSLDTMTVHPFPLNGSEQTISPKLTPLVERPATHHDLATEPSSAPTVIAARVDESLLRYNESRIRALRRCTRCVLPDTFPFIEFDDKGVCNYCHNYRPRYRGIDPITSKRRFIESLQHYRGADGKPDVLVAFSGGRDSSYGLHLIINEFGLTPITFTYDWGMVTELARRNIARICGQMGVQNILVSADIKRKRENIRKNVATWLRKPDLGLVPLFMAGDKHFFRVVNQLKRQTGIRLDLWCANPLENTDFKSGFCGVPPDFAKKSVDQLSFGRKARMALYYANEFLRNPGYINNSIPDTIGAFFAYYIEPRRDFFFIFEHFVWDENEVNATLLKEYDWELAPDTISTWRIGDGTAPFYNYIYITARGFSEFDTFRSNQIREGVIKREAALESVVIENRPRTESLRWYLDTVGLDFNSTIRRINELDELGLHQ